MSRINVGRKLKIKRQDEYMKKVCFVCAANLKHMTLISLYTRELEKAGQDYDIIYLDKYHEIERYEGAHQLFRYEIFIDRDWPFIRKFFVYYRFKKFAINTIEREKYDFVIVWNEFTAFLLEGFLDTKYAGRYCVNIRDENYNHIPFVQNKYRRVLKHSCFNTISSERFREIYPKGDYLFVQSYNEDVIQCITPSTRMRNSDEIIRVMFIGRMSYPETMRRVIDTLANDPRIELWLVGEGCQEFETYINELPARNIHCIGAFDPKETANYLRNADVIYSLNRENDRHSDTLLPIKLYYAIGRRVPILAFKTSYTYEYANNYGFAIGVSTSAFDHLGDTICSSYHQLSQEMINEGCKRAREDIAKTNEMLKELIKGYILSQ